jgi:hypothetical protein
MDTSIDLAAVVRPFQNAAEGHHPRESQLYRAACWEARYPDYLTDFLDTLEEQELLEVLIYARVDQLWAEQCPSDDRDPFHVKVCRQVADAVRATARRRRYDDAVWQLPELTEQAFQGLLTDSAAR